MESEQSHTRNNASLTHQAGGSSHESPSYCGDYSIGQVGVRCSTRLDGLDGLEASLCDLIPKLESCQDRPYMTF